MSLLKEVDLSLDGLSQVRALAGKGYKPGIARTAQFDLAEIESGKAVLTSTAGEHVDNGAGVVHGGYLATLLDTACGFAVHSMMNPYQSYTTVNLSVSYQRAVTIDSGLLRTEGTVRSMGRRVAFAEARVTDAAGRLCASATSTWLVFEVPAEREGASKGRQS